MTYHRAETSNSIELIAPFVEQLQDVDDIQIMGGLGTAALCDERTEILPLTKEVVAPEGFYLSSVRDDGTKRDVDVLVRSSDPARVTNISSLLEERVGTALEHSVFGIRPHEILRQQIAHPLGFRAFRTFLSDRYEADPVQGEGYVKSLFPFAVPLDSESLETWRLVTKDTSLPPMPIPHPATTILNYMNRSIGGVRPRDIQKVQHVTHNVMQAAPELKEWLREGPGQSQYELAKLIASLRRSNEQPDAYSQAELVERPGFLAADRSPFTQRRILATAAFKSTMLHAFESNPIIVTAWRQFAERHSDAIVKNM